jgi:hypothetical protein
MSKTRADFLREINNLKLEKEILCGQEVIISYKDYVYLCEEYMKTLKVLYIQASYENALHYKQTLKYDIKNDTSSLKKLYDYNKI